MERENKKTSVYRVLKEKLDNREFPPGSRLPNEVELAADLGVSRKTLRTALENLELENRIERIRGEGTFVRGGGTEEEKIKILAIQPEDPHISNPAPFILQGARLAAEHQNVAMEPCYMRTLLARPAEESARRIVESGVSGILLLTTTRLNPALDELLLATKLPVLLPHASKRDSRPGEFAVMGTDYEQVLRDGLRYLAAQGHRRVGHITTDSMRGISREEYFQFARAARLDEDPALLFTTASSTDRAQIFAGVDFMLDALPQPPTALFCFSDFFAFCVYERLAERKIRIPHPMAVLTIGGLLGCDYLNPPLSSIDFGSEEIGRLAIRLLLEMIREKRTFLPFTVTAHHINERESTRHFLRRQHDLR